MCARILYAAFAMCLLTTSGAAQTSLPTASLPNRTPSAPIPPEAPVLRSASLPDRTPQNPIPPARSDVFIAGPNTYVPRYDQLGRPAQFGFVGGFGYATDVFSPSSPYADRSARVQPHGYLNLDVQPASTQVLVDNLYVGTADDFRRLMSGRALEPGAHRLELRAPGHETVSVDVRIFPSETVTYREELKRSSPSGEKPVAAATPKTFYVIPGCYAGDKPPRTLRLPRACDAAKVRTIPPVVSTAARAR